MSGDISGLLAGGSEVLASVCRRPRRRPMAGIKARHPYLTARLADLRPSSAWSGSSCQVQKQVSQGLHHSASASLAQLRLRPPSQWLRKRESCQGLPGSSSFPLLPSPLPGGASFTHGSEGCVGPEQAAALALCPASLALRGCVGLPCPSSGSLYPLPPSGFLGPGPVPPTPVISALCPAPHPGCWGSPGPASWNHTPHLLFVLLPHFFTLRKLLS